MDNENVAQEFCPVLENTNSAKKAYSKLFLSLGFALGLVFLLQVLLGYFAKDSMETIMDTSWGMPVISFVTYHCIALPVFYLLVKNLPVLDIEQKEKLPFIKIVALFFVMYALTYFLNIFSMLLNFLIGGITGTMPENVLMDLAINGNYMMTAIYAVVLGPIFEEILFRRVLLNRLLPYGKYSAIVFSSLAFGLFHGNLYQLFYAVALGVFLAGVATYTNRLRYSIILHMAINSIGMFLIPFIMGDSQDQVRVIIAGIIAMSIVATGIIIFIICHFTDIKLFELPKDKALLPMKKLALTKGFMFFSVITLIEIIFALFNY